MQSKVSPIADAQSEEQAPAIGLLALREVKNARGEFIDLSPLALLLSRIEAKYHPQQIWLFGSRARGDERRWSDWDLFVVVPDEVPESDFNPLVAWKLQRDSGVRADVIPCRVSEFRKDRGTVNTICYEVATDGVLLYER